MQQRGLNLRGLDWLLGASHRCEFDTAVFGSGLGAFTNAIAFAGSACHLILAAVVAIFATYAVEQLVEQVAHVVF